MALYDGCILCGNVRFKAESTGDRAVRYRHCNVCGRYTITWALEEDIVANRETMESALAGLRAHTRQTSESGAVAELKTDNFKALAAGHLQTTVGTKLRRILEHLGNKSSYPGEPVGVHPDDYPLFDVAQHAHVDYLLETLIERRDIGRVNDNPLGHPQYVVTAAGWERLTPVAPGGVLGTVFVATAFSDDMQAAFDQAIQPAVMEDCGLTVTQVSRIDHNGSITDLILAGLQAAQIVIADVTHQRNGVYFEGGFGMGLGRVVVWMCREDDMPNVHFDTGHYNHIVWRDPQDLRTKLRNRLQATVANARRATQGFS